ncbi:MAG: Holliday junction resolvase RuvX [Rickettsiales bacterium]|nr:Holliday junction resolvase RuvX [Rickettsiales bacterium]
MLLPTPDVIFDHLHGEQRLIGLDVGEKTIGIALSDTRRVIASPMETIHRTKFTLDAQQIEEIMHGQNVGGIIVGLPLHADGSESRTTQSVRQFARNLDKLFPEFPIALHDERFTTIQATEVLTDAGLHWRKQAKHVDKVAACIILQSVLDMKN